MLLRDRLLARLAEMGDAPDHQRLAADVLGIRGAPPELWRGASSRRRWCSRIGATSGAATGERICRDAPATPASTC